MLFSAERSKASNTLVPGTRGFGREGPKYSAVQQKTCDVSCCRHRVFSFPVIYSGYVAGRSATYTESKRSRSQYRRLYCCLNGNTGLKAFLYVAFEWEKGILGEGSPSPLTPKFLFPTFRTSASRLEACCLQRLPPPSFANSSRYEISFPDLLFDIPSIFKNYAATRQ